VTKRQNVRRLGATVNVRQKDSIQEIHIKFPSPESITNLMPFLIKDHRDQ
jgi:hypothetical protein